MKKTTAVFVITLLAITLLTAGFWWGDFHVSRSETRVESQVSTYGFGVQEDKKLPTNLPVLIYVEGNDLLSNALRTELENCVEESPYLGQTTVLDSFPEKSDQSVLFIEINEQHKLWTPVYASSQLPIEIVFASDGDISWRDEQVVRMTNSDQPVVRVRGEFTARDTSFGMISRVYYHKYLAEQIATNLVKSLESSLVQHTS